MENDRTVRQQRSHTCCVFQALNRAVNTIRTVRMSVYEWMLWVCECSCVTSPSSPPSGCLAGTVSQTFDSAQLRAAEQAAGSMTQVYLVFRLKVTLVVLSASGGLFEICHTCHRRLKHTIMYAPNSRGRSQQ